MINVPQTVKDEFLSPAQKNLTLQFSDNTTLGNADIYMETMNFEQAICTETQMRFGTVSSACFKVQIKGTAKRYKGLKVIPTISVSGGGITLGEFTITEDELSDNREYRSLTAYDAIQDILTKDMSEWYTDLNLPMSLKDFRDNFFLHVGVEQEATTLPNDNMIVQRTVSTGDALLSGKKILECICELNGRFGGMVYSPTEGKSLFRYIRIKQNDTLYPQNGLHPNNDLYPHDGEVCYANSNDILQGGLVYQEYTSLPVDRVQIRNNTQDVGATYPNTTIANSNDYQITDNFLVYGKDATELENLARVFYDEIRHITYTPTKATMRGRPWQELGDMVIVSIKRTSVVFPILHRVISGITALKDEYEAQGNEKYTYNINSFKRQFEQVRQKTLEIVTTVDELRTTMTERVTDLENNVTTFQSQISQTAQQIQSTVDAHYSEQTTFQSQITQRANSIESRVSATESGISSLNSSVSTLSQTATEIRAEVQNATTHAAIVAKINDNTSTVKIQADKVDISGFVTFTDLSTSGNTTISGNNITTGIIQDAAGKNSWNLVTGNFTTSGLIKSVGSYKSFLRLNQSTGTAYTDWGFHVVTVEDGSVKFYYSDDNKGEDVLQVQGTIGMGSGDIISISADVDYVTSTAARCGILQISGSNVIEGVHFRDMEVINIRDTVNVVQVSSIVQFYKEVRLGVGGATNSLYLYGNSSIKTDVGTGVDAIVRMPTESGGVRVLTFSKGILINSGL